MSIIKAILTSNQKPKEKVSLSAEKIINDSSLFKELMVIMETGTDVEKGTCADIMKHVTSEKPEIAEPYLDEIIKYINYKAPRVKWGVPEAIGKMARKYPQKAEKAIPFLLKNTIENKENTTVIRWCAAYALSEIAKSSGNSGLISEIEAIAEKEKNNGVRNVYLKALKELKINKKT